MLVEPMDLEPLRRAIAAASDEIKRTASDKARVAAMAVVARMLRTYPVGPVHWKQKRRVGGGTLRASLWHDSFGVMAQLSTGATVPGARALAGVTAPHVHLYEEGTEDREDPTRITRRGPRKGQPAFRGRVQPLTDHPTFVETAIEERQRLLAEMQALVDRNREL